MAKNKTLIDLSSPPHIKGTITTTTIMGDVIIALSPALIWACYAFGWRSLYLTLISVASCVLFEAVFSLILRRRLAIGDLSAVVTGMILAFNLPVSAPVWFPVLGAFMAVIIFKGLFGGIGKNILNPALASVTVLFALFRKGVIYTMPIKSRFDSLIISGEIAAVDATPLKGLRDGVLPQDMEGSYSILDLFIGNIPGAIGEVSALLLLIGFVYLLVRRVTAIHTPLAYLGTVMILSLIFPKGAALPYMASQLFSGGLFLGAFFMANDYATSPVTEGGRMVYGVGCGALTFLLRVVIPSGEGVALAILIMNLLARPMDMLFRPSLFGGRGKRAD